MFALREIKIHTKENQYSNGKNLEFVHTETKIGNQMVLKFAQIFLQFALHRLNISL